MSRGLDNRNPGNIRRSRVRYKGEVHPSSDPEFKQFRSLEWGYRAVFVVLHTYRVRHGLRSVAQMIARWAPPTENRTDLYVRFVAGACGVAEDEVLDTLDGGTMIPLVRAVSRMENGVAADAAAVLRGWELFAEDYGGSRTAAETPSARVRSPGGVPAHAERKASRRGGPQCRAAPERAPGTGSRKRRNSTKSRGTTGCVRAFPLSLRV